MRRLIWLLIVLINTAHGGDLKKQLAAIINNGYGQEYVKGYMQPFATSVGIVLGSAVYARGSVKAFPGLDIGVKSVYVTLPDEALYFTTNALPGGGEKNVPTIFGDLQPEGDAVAGLGLNAFHFPLLQLNLGMFNNIEIMARYSQFTAQNFGRMTVWGGGFKYGLSNLLIMTVLPLDMSVQAMYHTFNLDTYISSGSFSMNMHVSLDIPGTFFSVYSGVTYENTSLVVKTEELSVDEGLNTGNISMRGKNEFRYNIGINAEFLIFNLHADYNFGYYHSIAGGLMLAF